MDPNFAIRGQERYKQSATSIDRYPQALNSVQTSFRTSTQFEQDPNRSQARVRIKARPIRHQTRRIFSQQVQDP